MNNVFDVIIPLSGKDVLFLPRVVKYIRSNISGAQDIYVISSVKNLNKLRKKGLFDCKLIDEDLLVENLNFDNVKKELSRYNYQAKTGWFFQQFLKIGFGLSKYSKKYYLSWDSDTLPLRNINFFEENNPLFTMKNEFNGAYFETIYKLFGLKKQKEASFIAEHMMFNVNIVREMVLAIENSNVEGKFWYSKIINAGDYNKQYAPFSEFETYGTYCSFYYPDLYKYRRLCTFRYAGYIRGRSISDKMLNDFAHDLDIASFEIYHGPKFPYNLKQIYYSWKLKWFRYKRMGLIQLVKLIKEKISK